MEFDREKFKRLVHYVIWRAGDKPGFGATKLYKVLWFADSRAYTLRGKPITGAKYIRQEYGPIPGAIMQVRAELEKAGLINISQTRHYNKQQTRFKANTKPDMSAFTGEEMRDVDYWIAHINEDHTAASISEESHDYTWEIAKMDEEIPLFAGFVVRLRESRGEELDWAEAEAKRLGLA